MIFTDVSCSSEPETSPLCWKGHSELGPGTQYIRGQARGSGHLFRAISVDNNLLLADCSIMMFASLILYIATGRKGEDVKVIAFNTHSDIHSRPIPPKYSRVYILACQWTWTGIIGIISLHKLASSNASQSFPRVMSILTAIYQYIT